MPAQLLLVNPSTPRRRLGNWGETLHRAPGFSGLSRYPYSGFSYANPAPRRRRRKRRNAAGAVAAVVSRRNPKKKRRASKPQRKRTRRIVRRARSKGVKHMATRRRRKKKVNSHAKKVKAYMRKHPKATLAKASKAVARGKGRKRRSRKNPSRSSRIAANMRKQGATPEQIEAALGHRKARIQAKWNKGSKGRKRSRAAKKGWAKRRKKGYRKSAKRHTRRASHRRMSRKYRRRARALALKGRRLTKRIKRTSAKIRATKSPRKRAKLRARRKAMVARRGALAVKRRALKRGWAGGAYARSHGLTRVNPSMSGVAKDLMALLPEVGAGVGSLVLMAVVGNKVVEKLPDSVKAKVPESVKPWVPTITTGILSAVAYGALRMSKSTKLSKLSVPVLIGGAAATAMHAMVAIKVKAADGTQISLAKKLGLPMGEFVGVSGYVDVNGQMVAVNGLGEFVGVSGMMTDATGQRIAVNGLGEYLHQEVGLGAAGDGIFSRSSLGMLPDGSAAQEAGMGREWSHGLSEEVGAESILDEGEGTLSGSIFDD